ncbi:MAG TPA: Vms1/Ankzf1 family peptidyl-tRNA hydrolase [Cryptosporangiaceae bacterium]|nr:Vms1/Ankzf1 family peptidyl-tRNA hydrolase [Cryptosporangiaceae bacterium]
MRLSFLDELYDRPGPFASVYLDTSRDSEDAAKAIGLGWRALRGELESERCPTDDLEALDRVIPGLRGTGPSGHAIFAAGGRVVYVGELVGPPRRETARFAPLPHVMPLVAQTGEAVPHVLAVVDRIGADITAVGSGGNVETEVTGSDHPIRKVAPGGWSQRRFQQRVEETWQHNAGRVARAVTDAALACAAEVVLVAGEERARSELLSAFGDDLPAEVVEVSGGGRAAGVDEEAFTAEVEKLLAERAAVRLTATMADYRAEAGRGGRAADGLAPCVDALRRAQVRTLLVNDDPSADATLFVGPEPTDLALRPEDLSDLGVAEPPEDRVDAALVRAAAGTDAEIVVVPAAELPLTGGVGALLRYVDQPDGPPDT